MDLAMEPIISKVFAGIGLVTVLLTLIRFFNLIQLYAKPCLLDSYKHQPEPWALVTGATDGIGHGFATELAERGFNVILHGRNAEKLATRKSELEQIYTPQGRKFTTLLLDASNTTPADFDKLDLPQISVLINNVGAGNRDRQALRFSDRTLSEIQEMISVNAGFATMLTRWLIPRFAKPAVIINIGSVLDGWGVAYLEPYSGAKGFNRSFSDALRTEMIVEEQKIEVVHVRVLSASTPGSRQVENFVNVSPRTMASGALDRVGCGAPSTAACLRHEFIIWIAELIPRDMLSKAVSLDVKKKIKKVE